MSRAESEALEQDVFEIDFLDAQFEAMTADEPFVAYVGGIGSGKTFLGSRWIVDGAVAYPDACHVATANTYPQLRDVVEPAIRAAIEERGIPYVWKASEKTFVLGGVARIIVRSLDNPNPLRGLEIDRWWGDEARDYSRDAWNVMVGRMRGRIADRPRALLTTTPNGFGEIYARFVERATPNYRVVSARTRDNPHLPPGYEAEVRAAYAATPELAEQELDGKFCAVGHMRACRTFSRLRHVRPVNLSKTAAKTVVCFDWNVGRIACVVVQEEAGEIRALRTIRGASTKDVVAELDAFLTLRTPGQPDWRFRALKIHGDAGQGAERSVQTGRTVWDDLLVRLEAAGYAPERCWPSTNPRVVERVVAFANAFESIPILVDPSCVPLIVDLERVAWNAAGTGLDDTDPDLTHCFDAFSYFIHRDHAPRAFRAPNVALDYHGAAAGGLARA